VDDGLQPVVELKLFDDSPLAPGSQMTSCVLFNEGDRDSDFEFAWVGVVT
jgi:hypothetical protein